MALCSIDNCDCEVTDDDARAVIIDEWRFIVFLCAGHRLQLSMSPTFESVERAV